MKDEYMPVFELGLLPPTLEKCMLQVRNYVGTHYMAVLIKVEMEDMPGVFEPGFALSVNLPETAKLPEDVFYAKCWAELEGVPEALERAGIIKLVEDIKCASSGFIPVIKPYRLTQEYIEGKITTPALVEIKEAA